MVGSSDKAKVYEAIGKRIRESRNAQFKSQQVVASAAGMDRTFLSMVEQGKSNVSIGTLINIANALEVPLISLLDGGSNG